MTDTEPAGHCEDPMQDIQVKIPCRLADRIYAYAERNDTTLENVMIEAIDTFLRNRKD
jgi:hypothetical protein